MSWQEYVRRTIGADQQKEAAEKAGLDQSAISRWLKTGTPGRAESVAAFARAYKRPVLEAFVAAGYMTSAEAKERPAAKPSLDSLSDDQLVAEIQTRLRKRGEHGGDTAATKAPGAGPDNVTELRLPPDADLDDLPDEADDPPPIGGGRQLPQAARRTDED